MQGPKGYVLCTDRPHHRYEAQVGLKADEGRRWKSP